MKFKVGGSTTNGTSSGLGGSFTATSTKKGAYGQRYHITVSMYLHELVCLVPTLKDPLNYEFIAVVEPGEWVRDWAFTKTAVPGCARRLDRSFRVDSLGDFTRDNGASASYTRSISATEEFSGQWW